MYVIFNPSCFVFGFFYNLEKKNKLKIQNIFFLERTLREKSISPQEFQHLFETDSLH